MFNVIIVKSDNDLLAFECRNYQLIGRESSLWERCINTMENADKYEMIFTTYDNNIPNDMRLIGLKPFDKLYANGVRCYLTGLAVR